MPTPDLLSFALSALVTLLVTIGPIEAAAVYVGLTSGVHLPERSQLAWRSVLIAGVLMLGFAFAGNPVLTWMRVSIPAFRFAARGDALSASTQSRFRRQSRPVVHQCR
ncbi:MAG: MarC family protein [Hyphomonadaceae bacterium]|nr:MarC family protein [Hyphomonadaceae bacterium]